MCVGPFALQRLDEAFDLAVPARRVGRRRDLACAAACEDLLEGVACSVAEGVVGHDCFGWGQAELGEVGQGALEEARARLAALIAVLLDIGVAAVIVDGSVDEDVAPTALVSPRLGRATADAVTRSLEGRQPRGVEVQQRAWP